MTKFVNSLSKIRHYAVAASTLREALNPLKKYHPGTTSFIYADYSFFIFFPKNVCFFPIGGAFFAVETEWILIRQHKLVLFSE